MQASAEVGSPEAPYRPTAGQSIWMQGGWGMSRSTRVPPSSAFGHHSSRAAPFHRSHANIHRRGGWISHTAVQTEGFFSQRAPLPRGAPPADNQGPTVGGEIEIDPPINVIERAPREMLQSAQEHGRAPSGYRNLTKSNQ